MSGMTVARRSTTRLGCWALVLAALLVGIQADAQLVRGSISGTVLDAQEKMIAAVQVTVTNEETGVQMSNTTGDKGSYTISSLEPGSYTIEFKKAGFETLRVPNVQVVAAKGTTIDRVLRTGEIVTEVHVTDVPGAEVEKTGATVQQTLPGRLLDEIPLPSSDLVPAGSRNQSRSALLAPNVVRVTGQNETSVNGHRGRENNYMADGVNNNDEFATLPALFIPPEAIREVQIQVTPFSAEFGRNVGAQINAITRNGTNRFRGELWEFYRTSGLEPLSLQSRRSGSIPCEGAPAGALCGSPRLSYHQFGASVGGPIVQNRTFFFGIFQGSRQRQSAKTLSSVTIPTANGYAALQSAPLRSGQSPASRQAMMDALSFLPDVHAQIRSYQSISTSAVTVNGTPIEVGTFAPVIPQNQNLWYFGFRLDHHFSNTDQFSYRLHFDDRITPLKAGNLAFGERWGADSQYNAQNHTLNYTKIVSDRFVNEARLAFARLDPSTVERDPLSPTLQIGGPTSFIIGSSQGFARRLEETFQFQNVSTHLISRHTLKFGLDLMRIGSFNTNSGNSRGVWLFPSLQDFMNNQASSLTQSVSPLNTYNFTQLKQAYFLQDDMKVTRNFTLNLGVRYETSSVPLGYFGATDPQVQALMVPGPTRRDTNNWAPRVGFAYSPEFDNGILGRIFGTGSSSIRGGIGVGYDVLFHSLFQNAATNYPRNTTQQAFTPSELLDRYPTPLVPVMNTPTLNPQALFVNLEENAQHPTSTYWSLSIQRQLRRGDILEVGYTGNRSYHLIRQGQANPGTITDAKAAAVIANCNATNLSTCENSTDPNDPRFPTSPSRLYPQFGSRLRFETSGIGEYHAGYVRFERRVARSLQFGASYTYSANLSDSDEAIPLDALLVGSSPQIPQDYLNRESEWARSAFDRPHRVAAHYAYRIPWFEDSPEMLRQVFAGWQLSGVTEVQSGQPFTIRVGVDALGVGSSTGTARPNFNPGGTILPDPVTGNYRTFTIPLDGTGIVTAPHVVTNSGGIVFLRNSMPNGGNLGRNTLRGPGFSNTNMSLMKRFTLPGEAQLQIRGDFINVFNHDNFPNPEAIMNNANTFGRQTLVPLTDARQVLLGAKLQF